jgi:citrate lyase subunit beta/citryl-CoA lyase
LRSGQSAVVRLNAHDTSEQAWDVEALRGVATQVMLPKIESAAEVASAVAALGSDTEVIALVETARGVAGAHGIAAHDAVVRVAFGNVDLAAELGVAPDDPQALLTARSLLSLASASAGLVGPVDGVTAEIDDEEGVATDAAHAASLGFRGKLCIHPRQLAGARRGLAPSPAEVSWAHRILAGACGGGARAVRGEMVDRPVEQRACDIVRRAELTT